MAVSVTGSPIVALNTIADLTANDATSTVAGATEVFTITPTKAGSKMLLDFYDASTEAMARPTYSIGAGDLWAGKAITGTFGSSAAAAGHDILQIDTARVLTDDGTILVTLTPGSTSLMLASSHHCGMRVAELL